MSPDLLAEDNLETPQQLPATTAQASRHRAAPKRRNPVAQVVRSLLEMLVLVLIAWSLLRAFEVESFAIPTGSMAPTLQGHHYQMSCPECRFEFRVGAAFDIQETGVIRTASCPICRFPAAMNPQSAGTSQFATGDSIMVDKSSYHAAQPRRWDVFVFKNPHVPKVNYVKRLVGLPREVIRIRHGDIYVANNPAGDTPQFHIARKPPEIARAMLLPVDDTRHMPQSLIDAGWPIRWQESSGSGTQPRRWTWDRATGRFAIEASDAPAWLRYRHFVPTAGDWQTVAQNKHNALNANSTVKLSLAKPQLISDYLSYNDFNSSPPDPNRPQHQGFHWVGDLGLECDLQIRGQAGHVLLELIEGGVRFRCRINVSSGTAELQTHGSGARWSDGDAVHRTAGTPIRGGGQHELLLTNLDNQVLLWVDDELVSFDRPTSYVRTDEVAPTWTKADPLDLAPAGICSDGATLTVNRLRVLRDLYYVATTSTALPYDYDGYYTADQIRDVFEDPQLWSHNALFKSRRSVEFILGENEFFPLGDNSLYSQDARYWGNIAVNRDFLIGKALLIYWPRRGSSGSWLPDFERLRIVR